jgi:hypothetical protein
MVSDVRQVLTGDAASPHIRSRADRWRSQGPADGGPLLNAQLSRRKAAKTSDET